MVLLWRSAYQSLTGALEQLHSLFHMTAANGRGAGERERERERSEGQVESEREQETDKGSMETDGVTTLSEEETTTQLKVSEWFVLSCRCSYRVGCFMKGQWDGIRSPDVARVLDRLK